MTDTHPPGETILAPHPFGQQIDTEQLIAIFDACRQWEDRYRQLIVLARQLPTLEEALRQPQIELAGCENQVWLGHQRQADGSLHFYGDSEGRIVRGLLAVLLTTIEGKRASQLVQEDPLALFDRLGLRQQLSSSRASGLQALAARVQAIARTEY